MKRSALFISFSVLVHLIIIDGLFYLITSSPNIEPSILISYNTIWLLIALGIISHNYYTQSRG